MSCQHMAFGDRYNSLLTSFGPISSSLHQQQPAATLDSFPLFKHRIQSSSTLAPSKHTQNTRLSNIIHNSTPGFDLLSIFLVRLIRSTQLFRYFIQLSSTNHLNSSNGSRRLQLSVRLATISIKYGSRNITSIRTPPIERHINMSTIYRSGEDDGRGYGVFRSMYRTPANTDGI